MFSQTRGLIKTQILRKQLINRFALGTQLSSKDGGCGKGGNKMNSVVEVEKFDDIDMENEPILQYKEGSEELCELESALLKISSKVEEIPIVINGKEIKKGKEQFQLMPHNHRKKIAKFYHADEETIDLAIQAAVKAQKKWDSTSLSCRIEIWERGADLLATKYRGEICAATMLGQAKTVYQAEIDAACELIDFFRMHAGFLKEATNYKPISTNRSVLQNFLRFRGLEGFVAAIAPFNFTAIGGNLSYTPALMGNGVVWKPSDTAILANWLIYKVMREAGVPDGVVNFVPADGPTFGKVITSSKYLSGINFTGSVPTFKKIWKLVGKNIDIYKSYPRLIGECGGKNFHFVHPSADKETVVACTIRAAFEYSGQKCSACSRLYVPESLWESHIKNPLVCKTKELIIGDVTNYKTFTSAVIDEKAIQRIAGYIEFAKTNSECKVICGGKYNNLKGYYVDPTIIEVSNQNCRLIKNEIFGPVLTVYVYKDKALNEAMDFVDNSTNFSLTGAIFANDEEWLKKATEKFKYTAGNFYINDKATGSVVGQQPFGGARHSGTNDKAGGPHYIQRWTSPQSIKETYVPMTDIYYPYMGIN